MKVFQNLRDRRSYWKSNSRARTWDRLMRILKGRNLQHKTQSSKIKNDYITNTVIFSNDKIR